MALQIYEFSRGFQETQKNGLWVSGGFGDKIDRYYENQVPLKIQDAVRKGFFEIPNVYRPNPGAEALINSGHPEKIAQPELNSIAIITRELENYCVLAVATGQIDDKGRDLIVGYQYFWLNVRELEAQIQKEQKPDGILTLLHWWLRNGQPCFDMNPNSRREYTYNQPDPYFKPEIQSAESYHQDPQLRESLLKVESEFPPFLVESERDGIQVNSTDTSLIFRSLSRLHLLALKANQDYEDCPLAWAWNVRGLSHPEEFAAIYCADPDALERIGKQKQRLPKKHKKSALQPLPASQRSSTSDTDYVADTSTTVPETQELSKVPSGTPANPDSLQSQIENKILNFVNSRNLEVDIDDLQELLNCYQKYSSDFDKECIYLLENKIDQYKDIKRINVVTDVRYICLLVILTFDLPENYLPVSQFKSPQVAISFLENLLQNTLKLKEGSAHESNPTYDKIEQRISRLLKSSSSADPRPDEIPHLNPFHRIWTLFISPSSEPPTPHGSPRFKFFLLIATVLAVLASILAYIHSLVDLAFQDTQKHWAKPYIQALVQQEIITVPDKPTESNYRPEDPMIRQEFATFINKAFPGKNSFFAGSQSKLERPNDHITRLEVLLALVKGLGLSNKDTQVLSFYTQENQIPRQTRNAVATATENGLVATAPSEDPRQLDFKQPATRAEIAAMVYLARVKAYPKKVDPITTAQVVVTCPFGAGAETISLKSYIPCIQWLEARLAEQGNDETKQKELEKSKKKLTEWMAGDEAKQIPNQLKGKISETEKTSIRKNENYIYISKDLIHTSSQMSESWVDYMKNLQFILNKSELNIRTDQFKLPSNLSPDESSNMQAIADFQNLYNELINKRIVNDEKLVVDGLANSNGSTQKARSKLSQSQLIKDAQVVAAWDCILGGLQAGRKFEEIFQPTKNSQNARYLNFGSCAKSNSGQ